MKELGLLFTTIVFAVYNTLLLGWAVSKLWIWFIVPVFHLPVLSIPAAIGLALIVKFLTEDIDLNKQEGEERPWEHKLLLGFMVGTFRPLMALFVGWIIQMWM